MTTFCPEFSAYWRLAPEPVGERALTVPAAEAVLSPAQQLALEELVERVNAARFVL